MEVEGKGHGLYWKKRQLKLGEKVNEEQVKMCEMLAVEKKKRKKAPG